MAGATKIPVAVEFRLHELVTGLGIVIGSELVTISPHRGHS